MDLGPVTGRPLRLFELADQPWFPRNIREKIQEMLTALWTHRLPFIQPASPAELAATLIAHAVDELEENPNTEVVIVDFCSGGGGPIPTVERIVNARRREVYAKPLRFLLSDLHPHVEAWKVAAARSRHIGYIPESLDAANASEDAIMRACRPAPHSPDAGSSWKDVRVLRLFCLSFHHFDDQLARKILEDTMETADGFAIIELQSRHISTFILMALYMPTLFLVTILWYPRDLGLLFFTYVVPIVPFSLVFDGVVSALRTRTFQEVLQLIDWRNMKLNPDGSRTSKKYGWMFEGGSKMHTWPVGYMNWVVGTRQPRST